MGSSKGGGGNPNTPSGMPVGPGGIGAPPPGVVQGYHPAFQSFLPAQAGVSATGLTQDMINQLNAPPPAPPPQAPAQNDETLRKLLSQLMSGGYVPPRDTNPGSAFSPFSPSSHSGGGYQSMRAGPMMQTNHR